MNQPLTPAQRHQLEAIHNAMRALHLDMSALGAAGTELREEMEKLTWAVQDAAARRLAGK